LRGNAAWAERADDMRQRVVKAVAQFGFQAAGTVDDHPTAVSRRTLPRAAGQISSVEHKEDVMRSRSLVSRVVPAITLAVAISSGAVFGQDNGSQVRIQGMPMVTTNGWSHTGIQDQQMQLSENISYADLNLATSSGVHELRSRVRDAANSICQKLGDSDDSNRGPAALEHQVECVNGALGDAMPQVDRVIASARQK
jgi:UrcA family protein